MKIKFNFKQCKKSIFITLGIIGLSMTMSACAPIVVGTVAAGAVASYTDRRPTNIQTTDKGIQVELMSELNRDYPNTNTEIAVWNRRVLIIGAVANQEQKDSISAKYSKHPNITHLFNELNVGFNPAIATKANDALLTSRLRTAFVAAQGINSNSIKIVSEGSKVYLLGWVTQIELEKAISVARQTSGVSEVVNLTEIVAPK